MFTYCGDVEVDGLVHQVHRGLADGSCRRGRTVRVLGRAGSCSKTRSGRYPCRRSRNRSTALRGWALSDEELALRLTEDAAQELEFPNVDGWQRFHLAVKPAARRKLRAGLDEILPPSA